MTEGIKIRIQALSLIPILIIPSPLIPPPPPPPQVVSKLTQIAFDRCVQKPDSSLSSSEITCIHAVTGKYLDGSEFVVKRLQKMQSGSRDQLLS